MRVLLTGAAGYLGSMLLQKLLARDHSVYGIDNLCYEQQFKFVDTSLLPTGTYLEILDTRNISRIERIAEEFKPDVIVHFGDLSSVYACNHHPEYTVEVSQIATRKLIKLASKMDIPFVYNSSSSVYGLTGAYVALDEESEIPQPTDLYCHSKLLIENNLATESSANKDFRFICFRPATVFGLSPRFRIELLPNHFSYSAIANGEVGVSNSRAFRAFISCDLLTDIYIKILELGNYPNRVYNIGSYNLSKLEVCAAIQRHADFKLTIRDDPSDMRNLQIDCSRFEREIFEIPKRSFEEEISEVCVWLRTNHELLKSSSFAGLLNMPLPYWQKLI